MIQTTITANNNVSEMYNTLNVKDFAKSIKSPDVFLLDVRHPDEFDDGHIQSATNLDVTSSGFLNQAKTTLPKDKTIAVYCRSGKRSAMASEILSMNGYKVINLDGGILNWEASGEPTVSN